MVGGGGGDGNRSPRSIIASLIFSNQLHLSVFFMQIDRAASTQELQHVLSEDDYGFQFDCGFNKPQSTIKFEDIPGFLRAVWRGSTIYSIHGELEQFKEAFLKALQMEHLVRDHPQVIQSLLAFQQKQVTADTIQDLFKVQYSPRGSNAVRDEQAVVMHWYTFLQECDGVCIT